MKKISLPAPVNCAVLGAGAIGLKHIESFLGHRSARVTAVAETSLERGREAATKFGIADVVADYRALLRRPDIHAVSIALPNHLHAPVALDALRAGKHVLLDKPMATNARDAAQLVREAQRRGLLLLVGQNIRFAPEVQTARKLVLDGELGEVYHAKTAWTRRAGIPRIGSWFTQKKFAGGGCCYDVGAHALDRALYLLGEFEAVAVSGQTFSQLGPRGLGEGSWGKGEIDPDKPFDVEDLAVALIKLRSGRTVLLETSWAAHQGIADYNGTQLFGTLGGLSVPDLQLFRPGRLGYTIETVKGAAHFADPNRMVHFIDCLLGKATPFVPATESLAVQRILDAIYRSAVTGREIRLK